MPTTRKNVPKTTEPTVGKQINIVSPPISDATDTKNLNKSVKRKAKDASGPTSKKKSKQPGKKTPSELKKLMDHNNPGNIDSVPTESTRSTRQTVKSNPMETPVNQKVSKRVEPKLGTKAKKPSYLEVAKSSKGSLKGGKKSPATAKAKTESQKTKPSLKGKTGKNNMLRGKSIKKPTHVVKAKPQPKKTPNKTLSTTKTKEVKRKHVSEGKKRQTKVKKTLSTVTKESSLVSNTSTIPGTSVMEQCTPSKELNTFIKDKKTSKEKPLYAKRGVKTSLIQRLDKTKSDTSDKNKLTMKIEVAVDDNIAIV